MFYYSASVSPALYQWSQRKNKVFYLTWKAYIIHWRENHNTHEYCEMECDIKNKLIMSFPFLQRLVVSCYPKENPYCMEWWTCSLTAWSCPPFPASSSSTAYACQVPDPLVSHWDVLIIPECIIHFNTSFGNGFVIII